jgi:hypothetical protein
MTMFSKLGVLAIAVLILVALWLSATRLPVPVQSATVMDEPITTINFMVEDIQLAAGLAFGAMGNFEAARSLFARIRENDPSSPLGYGPVAGTYMAEGQLIEALFWMREAQAVDPRNFDHGAWMVLIYDCLEDYQTAGQWADWLNDRVTNQPLPMAMQASHHYVSGHFQPALQYSNLAIKFGLSDHWGSDAVFMRIKRDEARRAIGSSPSTGSARKANPRHQSGTTTPMLASFQVSGISEPVQMRRWRQSHTWLR